MRLDASVLGRIELRADERTVDVGGPRQRRLLAALLLHHGEVVPTHRLIDAVWDGAPPPAAEGTFRSYIARLRRAIDDAGCPGAEVVTTAPSGYAISRCVEVDAARFEAALGRARRRLELGDPAAAHQHVERALDCWHGDAFAEFADEEWAVAEAVRLEELRLVAQELAVETALERGAIDAAIADGRRLAQLHPLRERPHELLMEALYRGGRPADALRIGREHRERLREETGLDPSRSFEELEQRILDNDAGAPRRRTLRSVRGYELGEVLRADADTVMHRARRHAEGDDLILLVVGEHVADDPRFIREFELGARERASIRHAGLAPWYDHWREPGAAYVVCGLPSGGAPDRGSTARQSADADGLVRFVRDIGGALAALHGAGIVHGGLTSSDVWFDHDRPVLIGPVPGLAGPAEARDDVIAFAALVLDHVRRSRRHAGSGGTTDRLERLLDSACEGAFETEVGRLVDEALGLLGARRGIAGSEGAEPNPYRGLEAFDERHAPFFFGRGAAAEELDREVRQHPFVAVVGASGSGKSSLVRAGLVPRIRADGWLTTVMQPGARPVEELGLALGAVSTLEIDPGEEPRRLARQIGDLVGGDEPMLLVIDQFEELWTVAEPGQRDALLTTLDELAHHGRGAVHTVVTLRADHLGRALGHGPTGALLRDHTILLAPMTTAELAEAIVEPARAVGVTVETELAAAIVAEAGQSPGSLPMIQFALTELFEQRVDGVMTLDAYRRIGGLAGVITQRAEDTFARFTPDEQRAAELALTRLVSVDGSGDPTRRRLTHAELAPSASSVIDAFGRARLLTFDRDRATREQVVEIAHESLTREWPRLRSWIAEDQESLHLLRRLSAAASGWVAGGRDPADLYRGSRLEVTESWARAHPDRLTAVEDEFLRASRRQADTASRTERRRTERLRALALGLVVALVAATALGAVAAGQRRQALVSAEEATTQRLATQALAALDVDPDLAILLALEAVERAEAAGLPPAPGALEALHSATQSSRLLARFPDSSAAALSPDGGWIALERGDDVELVDVSSRDTIARASVDGDVTGLWFGSDGARLLVSTEVAVTVLEAPSLTALATERVACCIVTVELHPDGERAAAELQPQTEGSLPRVHTWSLSELRPLRSVRGVRLAGWMGDDVVVHDGVRVLRVGPTGPPAELDVPTESLTQVAVHPDGDRLVVADAEGVAVWSDAAPDVLEPIALDGWGVLFQWLALDRAGEAILAGGASDEVRWLSLEDGRSRALRGHRDIRGLATDASGERVVVSGTDETLLWDLSDAGPRELGAVPVGGEVWSVEFADDGRVIHVADQTDGTSRVRAIDLATGAVLGETRFGGLPGWVYPVMSPAGLAAGWAPEGSRIEHLVSGEVAVELGPCQVPAAIDAEGRWLLLRGDVFDGCPSSPGSVIDPWTGATLRELPEQVGLADLGPPGTISEGLAAYQDGPEPDVGIRDVVLRDVRTGELLGRLEGRSAWRPFFSNDGRFLAFGSGSHGGFAIDVEQVVEGASMEDAIVLNTPRVEGGATSFSLVVGDQLVTGHAGEVLHFWGLADGGLRLELPVRSGDTTFIAAPPGDRYLYYEDDGDLLRRFPLDADELVELAERRVQRDFRPSECERYRLSEDCAAFLSDR